MKEFFKSFFSFGVATSIQKMLGFILLPLYTRLFTKADFGVLDMIQVILGITSVFAVLQLETALQRYYYEYSGEKKKNFIFSIFITITLISFFLTGVLLLFPSQFSALIFKTEEYAHLIALASIQLPFINFSMLAFILLRYEKKNKAFLGLVLLKVVLTLSLVLLFVVRLELGIEGVLFAQLISLLVSSIFIYFAVRRFFIFSISVPLLKQAFLYAYPQIPARIGSITLSYANRFFMMSFLTIASIGIYSVSLKLASAIQLVYSAFIMAWAPFMFEQLKKEDHKQTFANVLSLASAPIFLLVSVISLFSRELVMLIASEEYFEAHRFVGGLSLYFALYIIKEIVDIGPKVLEKTKFLSYTFFISVIVNVLALYFLVPVFSLSGVVYSLLLTNVFLVAMSWFVSNKLYYIPFKIINFSVLALPAFILAIYSMYQLPSLIYKLLLSIILIMFYGTFFWIEYTLFNSQLGTKSNNWKLKR